MPYQLIRNDNALTRIILSGELTQADIANLLTELTPLNQIATAPAVCVLVDAARLEKVDLAARQGIAEISRRRTAKKIGVIGLSPYVRVLTTFISKAIGRGDTMRLFATEAEAVAWLKE